MENVTKHNSVVIVGFGNQAKSWALNLRDSGRRVFIGLRPESDSIQKANDLGFQTIRLNDPELKTHHNFLLLTPDSSHEELLEEHRECFPKAARIIYAHGYSVHYGNILDKFPTWSHLLLAPKSIASELRFQYETKGALGAVFGMEYALAPEEDKEFLLKLASDLGITSGPHPGSFQEETVADLFSEQSILCSVLPYASLHCYNLLREKGISKEVAYFESWYEVKLIVDTMVKLGPEKFFELISPNALIGSEVGRKALFGAEYHQALEKIFSDIQGGSFSEYAEAANVSEIRMNIQNFWSQQELTKTHRELEKALY